MNNVFKITMKTIKKDKPRMLLIHCLNSLARRHPTHKSDVVSALNKFIDDPDEMVVTYAKTG